MKQTEVKYTYGNGKTETRIRLYADSGRAVTQDGVNLYGSIDVLSADGWYEVDYFEPMENPTDEEALTRYANSLTGANDPDLLSAAETLITERIKENSDETQ